MCLQEIFWPVGILECNLKGIEDEICIPLHFSGGFGFTEEMCVNYIHYYPTSELEVNTDMLVQQSSNME